MENIKVSIITVCYNSVLTIEKTIASVLNQTYKNIEYIIIDGASVDGTIDIIDKYKDLFDGKLIVVSEKDDGIYYAMNKGIGLASGKLIGILNSDDWYEPDAVEKILRSYENKHDNPLAVYYGNMGMIRDGKLTGISKSDHNNLENEMIAHPSCFITKNAYDQLGVYDTQYTSVADYDLMLRYKRSGEVDFIYVDEYIANFTLGGMSSTGKAYIDLLRLRMNYGKLSRLSGSIEIAKARLAEYMEKHGLKPIQIRKK